MGLLFLPLAVGCFEVLRMAVEFEGFPAAFCAPTVNTDSALPTTTETNQPEPNFFIRKVTYLDCKALGQSTLAQLDDSGNQSR